MKTAYELKQISLRLTDILPGRQINESTENSLRYRYVFASIKEVGVIEPMVVVANNGGDGKYRLIDGHIRWLALKNLGETMANCLLSTDAPLLPDKDRHE